MDKRTVFLISGTVVAATEIFVGIRGYYTFAVAILMLSGFFFGDFSKDFYRKDPKRFPNEDTSKPVPHADKISAYMDEHPGTSIREAIAALRSK